MDDEPSLLRSYRRVISKLGHSVVAAESAEAAHQLLQSQAFDLVISDINLPGMDGLELLRRVRERDLDLPVIFITGHPAIETAARAVEYGALRYLLKPVGSDLLAEVVEKAIRLRRMAGIRRLAAELSGDGRFSIGDRAGLEAAFRRAMDGLYMAYQPIVRWSDRSVFAHEALLRCRAPAAPLPDGPTAHAPVPARSRGGAVHGAEGAGSREEVDGGPAHPGPVLSTPAALLDAAERLGRLFELGRAVRGCVAATLVAPAADPDLPPARLANRPVFVNLHAADLLDESLFDPAAPLSRVASRVVLEITERASLDAVRDLPRRVGELRRLGYRIAVDDLGAGYAGLTSFAQLEPEVVKLDMSLVRGVHLQPTKAKLIRSLNLLCKDMALSVVAEGIEEAGERDALISLGCDLLQGYLFARPAELPPAPRW